MSDTTATVTSDVKLCVGCGATFGEDDDKRYKDCTKCRVGEAPAADGVSEGVNFDTVTNPVNQTIEIPKNEPGVEPLRIEGGVGDIPPPPPRLYYWCGVTKDAPWALVTLGGINFQKTKGRVQDVGQGKQQFQDDTADGMIHHLTQNQVDIVLEHAANKSVRNFRRSTVIEINSSVEVTSGDLVSHKGSGARPYLPQAGDIPIGCFVYMIKVRGKKDRPLDNPPTLVERDF